MEKISGVYNKCDECEELVFAYVEFHSRLGYFVKVCMSCISKAAQHSVQATGLCPFCQEPIATEHAHEFCYPPEPPRA